jgi:hypothetical protein
MAQEIVLPVTSAVPRHARTLRYATIGACLPYMALKIAWIAGSGVGAATAEMGSPKFVVGNVITVLLELVVIALIVQFTTEPGRGWPIWMVLGPIWVGTGLLAPVALGVPAGVLAQLIAGGSPIPVGEELQAWVFATVYGGFVAQAVLLLAGFLVYVRGRWPWVLALKLADLRGGVTEPVQRLLFVGSSVAALGYGAVHVVWAMWPGELGGDPAAVATVAQQTAWLIQGLLGLGAGVGALALTYRQRAAARLPLVATWVGSAFVFSSGVIGGSNTPISGFVHLVGAVTGVMMATAALLLLMETRPVLMSRSHPAAATGRRPGGGWRRGGPHRRRVRRRSAVRMLFGSGWPVVWPVDR